MKKNSLISMILASFTVFSFAQDVSDREWVLNFETSYPPEFLIFDPDTSESYSWKIINPDTPLFGNAIATGGNEPYAENDTISFTILHPTGPSIKYGGKYAPFEGYYYVDCDSLNDFGTFELSLDKGESWKDMLNDQDFIDYVYPSPKPVLTGRSDWKRFSFDLSNLSSGFLVPDTIHIRITFISDSIFDNRKGLFFDEMVMTDIWTNVDLHHEELFYSRIWPNPFTDNIRLDLPSSTAMPVDIEIFDAYGRIVLTSVLYKSTYTIDLSSFPDGLYFLSIKNKRDILTRVIYKNSL